MLKQNCMATLLWKHIYGIFYQNQLHLEMSVVNMLYCTAVFQRYCHYYGEGVFTVCAAIIALKNECGSVSKSCGVPDSIT